MTPAKNQMRRIIGMDLHPDSFAAAQVTGSTIAEMTGASLCKSLISSN